MLSSLTIRDIVLIEKAELEFAPGLTVLTGETGAGKSILLDALGLAAGARGTGRAALRSGAEQGAAIAIFDPARSHVSRSLLEENGLGRDGEMILRRVVSADGRTRAFVNDQPVSVTLARDIGALLLEVHGQADDRGLFDLTTHRTLLDAAGGHGELAREAAGLHAVHMEAVRRRAEIEKLRASASAEIDLLSYAVRELSQLGPEQGEEGRLASERALLMNASRIAEDIGAALEFLSGDGGAELSRGSALRRISRMTAEGRKAAAAAEGALEAAITLTEEARRDLEQVASRLDAEPGRLETVEERLFALRAVARKFNVPADRLPALRAEFEAKLALLDTGEEGVRAAEREAARTREAWLAVARMLSAARRDAAKALEQRVARELAPLKMGAARFRVALTPLSESEAGAAGLERVAFEVATVEGAGFGPLTKIASGGELSRFALALKLALAEASPPATLVFDEIDRGVGGAVADAVGERLQRLAKTTQILLVTHSPQVAARGNTHFRITRRGDMTKVERLREEERVEEIARMLAGASVTAEARAAARKLLDEAHAAAPAPRKRARA
jgi:DNA repair protein RecN (Recombination protein N)